MKKIYGIMEHCCGRFYTIRQLLRNGSNPVWFEGELNNTYKSAEEAIENAKRHGILIDSVAVGDSWQLLAYYENKIKEKKS